MPRVTLPPEENAQLLCVYMRPWTLNPADDNEQTPLLSRLGMVQQDAPSTEECNNRTDSTHNRTKAKENIAHAGSAQIRTEDHDNPASKDEQSQHRNNDKHREPRWESFPKKAYPENQ